MTNYYRLLKLQPTARPEEIEAAYQSERYRLLSAALQEEELAESLKGIEEAYTTLVDPGLRAAYDRKQEQSAGPSQIILANELDIPIISQPPPAPIVAQKCPHCGEPNPVQALKCRSCKQQIYQSCPNCGQHVILGQTVCPRCSTYIPEYVEQRFTAGKVTHEKIAAERRTSESRVQALEAGHRANARLGIIFWIIVFAICSGLTLLTVFLGDYFGQVFQ